MTDFGLRYHPVLGDAASLVAERAPLRLLLVGSDVLPYVTDAGVARVIVAADVRLPVGVYLFVGDDGVEAMVVSDGETAASATTSDWSDAKHPLIDAYGWFECWWDKAEAITKPAFGLKDQVRVLSNGKEGAVQGRRYVAGSWTYEVRVDGKTAHHREQSLGVAERDDDPVTWVNRPPAPARRFAATLTRAKLTEQLSDTVFSYRSSRTLFRPYQFRPVMRLLATGGLRLLIADEVGLGKTIEAGLVWTELDARSMANRVLVVCPSMLVAKWRSEMEARFGFELAELRRRELDEMLERIESDRPPGRFHAICSLERLRSWSGLARLADIAPRFDLVIVDEAHAFRNLGTQSHALGSLLSEWADALVFLSATPLNLGNDDLFNLLQLLAPGEFANRALLEAQLEPNAVLNRVQASLLDRQVSNDERLAWLHQVDAMTYGPTVTARPEFAELEALLRVPSLSHAGVVAARRLLARLHVLSAIVTRTRKVDVADRKAVREAHTIEVTWSEAERDFYDRFEAWQFALARRRGLPPGFSTQMPLRLASSCLPAARRQLLDDHSGLFEADLDEEDEDGSDAPLRESPPPELLRAAERLGDADAKFDRFVPMLRDIVDQGRQVLLFTFSRRTLAYLEARLAPLFRIAVLHGGIAGDERQRVMRAFRAGEHQVLLASRVASEGLDFEFCSAVVNYDLPWNPMEVEQRIGRIDRFGQASEKVHILNFETPGTIETDIVARLMARIGVFKDSIGDLEPILQSQLADIRKTTFDLTLSPEQRNRRLDEQLSAVEEQRRALDEVEAARAYLSSTDDAEIDGLERDLRASGRYVGQPELVLLVEDWASACAGATCTTAPDGKRLVIRGTAEMEQHLRRAEARAARSPAEAERLAQKLRDEQELIVSLDQELARTTGEDLLSANHPLTRAALEAPGARQARFSHLLIRAADAPAGRYFVLLSIAQWEGLRPSRELWASSVDAEAGHDVGSEVGDALLAALAAAGFEDTNAPGGEVATLLERALDQLLRRQVAEEGRRLEENRALIATRRISLHETHARKVAQIEQRLHSVQASGNAQVARLFEAQLATQARQLRESEARLDAGDAGSLTVEPLAACLLEIAR